MKKLVILCLLCLFGMVSTASAQYAGGDGEGHVNTLLSTSFPAFLNLFTGTDGDGYDDASSEPSDAATRYVATTGEDAFNNCTDQTQPCVTIAQAVSQANPGDTLDLAAGTYTLSMNLLIDKALTNRGRGWWCSRRHGLRRSSRSTPPRSRRASSLFLAAYLFFVLPGAPSIHRLLHCANLPLRGLQPIAWQIQRLDDACDERGD